MSGSAGRRLRAAARFRSDEGGQALVEFAMVLPVLLGLLVGILELGQAWRAQQVVTHSVREGARLAIVPASGSSEVTERIRQALSQGGLDPTRAKLTLGLRSGTGTSDTVRVEYPHALPLLGPVSRLMTRTGSDVPPGSIVLTSTYVMRNE